MRINHPTVKTIDLDKNCEACQAAGRAIEASQYVSALATKKIAEQDTEIRLLRAQLAEANLRLIRWVSSATPREKFYDIEFIRGPVPKNWKPQDEDEND